MQPTAGQHDPGFQFLLAPGEKSVFSAETLGPLMTGPVVQGLLAGAVALVLAVSLVTYMSERARRRSQRAAALRRALRRPARIS